MKVLQFCDWDWCASLQYVITMRCRRSGDDSAVVSEKAVVQVDRSRNIVLSSSQPYGDWVLFDLTSLHSIKIQLSVLYGRFTTHSQTNWTQSGVVSVRKSAEIWGQHRLQTGVILGKSLVGRKNLRLRLGWLFTQPRRSSRYEVLYGINSQHHGWGDYIHPTSRLWPLMTNHPTANSTTLSSPPSMWNC